MNIHLYIPSLFWSDLSQQEIYHDLSLPALETILAKSSYDQNESLEIDAWLCDAFGIKKQQNLPVAPLMLPIDGAGKNIKIGKDYWMRADPVHLRIEQNHIMLADSQAFQITKEEAKQFTELLNSCFSKDDLQFLPLHPDRWYICLPQTPLMHTYTLSEVTCKNINDFLPFGKDSIAWHKIFNEIQMLLHEHPLNQAREALGELAINSIWFWGGGITPESINSSYTQIWSNHDFPRALGFASQTPHAKLPSDATTWHQSIAPGNHLVVLDALLGKYKYKDAYGWREGLKKLENNWFAPLYTALHKGSINQLTITATNETSSMNFIIKRSSLWKFWLTKKPLSHFSQA